MTESLFDTKFAGGADKPEATAAGVDAVATSTTNASNAAVTSSNDEAGSSSSTTDTADSGSSPIAASGASTVAPSSSTLPSLDDNSSASALINYRVLVSAKEAGCLIGQNGTVINSIREVTNTKAGISKLQNGSHERILTVSGTLDDCSKALSYFAQALCNASAENLLSYNFFPLKQLSSIACVEGKTTVLRLLVPNAQMGTLIGSKGLRIQQLQSQFDISMIASKSFLPNSNERLVELQGSVDNLYDSLRVISRCLIEDFSSIVGTNYYTPRGFKRINGNVGGVSNISGVSGGSVGVSNASNTSTFASTTNSSSTNHNESSSGRSLVTDKVPFPNEIVGALIGKNGSRIQGVRKVSGATIGISDEVEGQNERVFTISGTSHAVEKAKGLLYHNLEREEARRLEAANESQ
ncbi:heterogeneous nuclear rnp K-like protein 2 [[Candida] anglica]|uniref:Heterogeneous nuclear rnp K-like protein 2 n=1 Tax=[Candida] anglica TaxID=148631 RepID=A0ABP0EFD2_9ASCO